MWLLLRYNYKLSIIEYIYNVFKKKKKTVMVKYHIFFIIYILYIFGNEKNHFLAVEYFWKWQKKIAVE